MYIIFDMYGVIIKESKGNFIPYVYKHFPNTDRRVLVELFNNASNGKITGTEFISKLGFTDVDMVTKDYIQNYLTFDNDFLDFVEKHKDNFKYILLSNDVLTWSEYITSYYNIDKYFDEKIISGAVNCRKPEKEIYELMLQKLNVLPNECIFIDNSVKNLDVAESMGIKTILFNRDNEDYKGDTIYSFKELSDLVEREYL